MAPILNSTASTINLDFIYASSLRKERSKRLQLKLELTNAFFFHPNRTQHSRVQLDPRPQLVLIGEFLKVLFDFRRVRIERRPVRFGLEGKCIDMCRTWVATYQPL